MDCVVAAKTLDLENDPLAHFAKQCRTKKRRTIEEMLKRILSMEMRCHCDK